MKTLQAFAVAAFVLPGIANHAATAKSVSAVAMSSVSSQMARGGTEISLNGAWEMGIDRHYAKTTLVPGLVANPSEITPGTLWYRREIHLPEGDWNHATLTLNGARFAPTIYVDGEKVSTAAGGMAPTVHLLRSARVAPGRTISLEIALKSLADLDPADASAVPAADRWRSDISSGLWDKVTLRFHGESRIARVIPWTQFAEDRVSVHWEVDQSEAPKQGLTLQALILDKSGNVVARSDATGVKGSHGAVDVPLHHACKKWSPEYPVTYRLKLLLNDGERLLDSREITWGFRDFKTDGLGFRLNGEPVTLRAGTVVWHRWLRDPEAKTLAFDEAWFEKNIVLRLKSLGANTLRFHLGLPPESFLDLCDKHGIMVQMEWPFFHGITASQQSMEEQWRSWLDVGIRHPSVVLIHPWNETEGDLTAGWAALDAILPEYPRLVVSHRDVIHIHKYWWSLFENVGLYYDSNRQFDRPIMVDEFGGNYLDGDADPGLYPAVRESFLRFLGRNHNRELRLQLHAEANARIAEYWRRLGAAGFSPFCALGSPQDGNNWFLGTLKDGNPKPVWAALAAAYSPVSVSLEVWDRNYLPGQTATLPLYFFNDTGRDGRLSVSLRVLPENGEGRPVSTQDLNVSVPSHGRETRQVTIALPAAEGEWRFEAVLNNPPASVTYPVVSSWRFRTLRPSVPPSLADIKVAIPDDEVELKEFARQNRLAVGTLSDPDARIVLGSVNTWQKLTQSLALRNEFEAAIRSGRSVVLLDVGPRDLGHAGPLDGAPRVQNPKETTQQLFQGVEVKFTEAAEPESAIHPAQNENFLWAGLPPQATWLWNGLRGGLIVPAADMEVTSLRPAAFLSLWQSRGADTASIEKGDYFAFELAGFYEFSHTANDSTATKRLREKVKLLADDAPSLKDAINPNAPIRGIDLANEYRKTRTDGAEELLPLANCGKNLTRTPIVKLRFGDSQGALILSQAITAGRLVRSKAELGLYGIRHDPAAEQFVLNLITQAANK